MLGCAIQAMGEAFSLVRKYDVAPQVLYDVMTEGLFSAPAYKVYGKIIVDESLRQGRIDDRPESQGRESDHCGGRYRQGPAAER